MSFLLRNHLKDNVDTKTSSNFANNELVQPEDCENLFKLIEMAVEKAFTGSLFTQRFGLIKNNLERQKTILEENEEG